MDIKNIAFFLTLVSFTPTWTSMIAYYDKNGSNDDEVYIVGLPK